MAVRRDGHCGAAGVAAGLSELGFTDRMKAMILQRSSLVLIIPPKGGWPNHDFMLHAGIASFCQSVRAERYQGEKRVVVAAVNPCVIRERRTHAASAASPMAAIAAGGEVSVVTLLGNGSNIGVVGIFQVSLRGAGDKFQGRRGGPSMGPPAGAVAEPAAEVPG